MIRSASDNDRLNKKFGYINHSKQCYYVHPYTVFGSKQIDSPMPLCIFCIISITHAQRTFIIG